MPQPDPAALHNQKYTIVGNSVIGNLPTTTGKNRRRGELSVARIRVVQPADPARDATCVISRVLTLQHAQVVAVANVSTSHHRS